MIDALTADNRLYARIQRARDAIARRVRLDNGQPLAADLDLKAFERTLDNTFDEHFAYQTLQSRAHAMGKLSTAEAQVIYMALGEVPSADGWAEGTDLATKLIVTEVIGELAGIVR